MALRISCGIQQLEDVVELECEWWRDVPLPFVPYSPAIIHTESNPSILNLEEPTPGQTCEESCKSEDNGGDGEGTALAVRIGGLAKASWVLIIALRCHHRWDTL